MSAPRAPQELVLASAGSGKTFRISSRLITLLAHGVDADAVLAATFTRKAAGQILERVLERIATAALSEDAARELATWTTLDPRHPVDRSPRFWSTLLERTVSRLHRFNVGTLDSFFMRTATAFEPELGLPAGWRIPDEPTLQRLRSRALLQVLENADSREIVELLRLAARGAIRRSVHDHLLRVISDLLEIEEQLDPYVPDPWGAFSQGEAAVPTAAVRERLAARVSSLQIPRTKSGTENQGWANARDSILDGLRQGNWEAVVGQSLCRKVAEGEGAYYRHQITAEVQQSLEEVLDAARAALRPRLAAQVQALGTLTRAYREVFRAMQREQGLFGFSDVTRLIGIGDPLRDRADLYYRLDARTHHILLDEFQDTSHGQWEALEPIVDEILSEDGRSAVLVADPKQSIYGWRGADPDIVHAVGRRYSLKPDHLARSWRSSQVVLDFVNQVFSRLEALPIVAGEPLCAATATRWRQDFREHEAAKSLPGYVRLEVGPSDEGRGSDRPLLCRAVAERVAELRNDCPGASIGVLTRTNSGVAQLFLALQELDVPVSQEGGNPLTDSAACEAVLALLRLADHPGDTIARYHVAASPLGAVVGYTDHRDGAAADLLAARTRRRLVNEGYGSTITALARRIAPSCDAREARRLSQLGELGYRYDRDASLRPCDFVRRAESERIEDRATADVRVMTVHQAKGLEFDIVVLPQLDDPMVKGGGGQAALPFRQAPGGRITAVLPSVTADVRCLFPELEEPFRQRKAAILRDGLSTLYVGLTRAIHALHILVAPDARSGPGTSLSPARIIREALSDPFGELVPAVPGETLYEDGDPNWYAGVSTDRTRVTGPDATPQPTVPRVRVGERRRVIRRRSPSQLHGSDDSVDVRELLRLDPAPLERGTLVHAWFEQIEWVEHGIADDAELLNIARTVAPAISQARATEMLDEFRGWLTNPAIRNVLSRTRYSGRSDVEREVPFVRRTDSGLMEGVIDRLVVSYAGDRPVRAEVIDYKTDRTGRDTARIRSLANHYSRQLAAYVDAVCELYAISRSACTASLVFLEAGVVEGVSTDEPVSAVRPEQVRG